jgi:hypothetical protein
VLRQLFDQISVVFWGKCDQVPLRSIRKCGILTMNWNYLFKARKHIISRRIYVDYEIGFRSSFGHF